MINLGPAAYDAIHSLRNTEHWSAFVDAIGDQAGKQIQMSLAAPVEQVPTANFYARAWNDLYIALVAATKDINPRAVPKPGVKADV